MAYSSSDLPSEARSDHSAEHRLFTRTVVGGNYGEYGQDPRLHPTAVLKRIYQKPPSSSSSNRESAIKVICEKSYTSVENVCFRDLARLFSNLGNMPPLFRY